MIHASHPMQTQPELRAGGLLSCLVLVDRRSAAGPAILLVQMVVLDVVDDGDGDQIAHAHLAAQEEADLGAADIVLDELLDDVDVVFPGLQGCEGLVDVGAAAFDDEGLYPSSVIYSCSVWLKCSIPRTSPGYDPDPSRSTPPALTWYG